MGTAFPSLGVAPIVESLCALPVECTSPPGNMDSRLALLAGERITGPPGEEMTSGGLLAPSERDGGLGSNAAFVGAGSHTKYLAPDKKKNVNHIPLLVTLRGQRLLIK